jgi:hypothetical protein
MYIYLIVMKLLLKITVVAILIMTISAAIIACNHPIFLKWLSGTAKIIGKPISSKVLMNDNINQQIRVYELHEFAKEKELKSLIIYYPHSRIDETRRVLFIQLNGNYISRPCTNKSCFDDIFGYLFMDEVASNSIVPFQNDIKGFAFDPRLDQSIGKIKFIMPQALRHDYEADSLTINLNDKER